MSRRRGNSAISSTNGRSMARRASPAPAAPAPRAFGGSCNRTARPSIVPNGSAEVPEMLTVLEGVAPLAEHYDAFVLDIWGVLHDGVAPYPGVIRALEALNDAGKRVALLSNAPMRAEIVAARVERIGIPRRLFHHVVS